MTGPRQTTSDEDLSTGDVVTGENGKKWTLGELVAIEGLGGCQDTRCRRNALTGACAGYHCPVCLEPCSMVGHKACREAE